MRGIIRFAPILLPLVLALTQGCEQPTSIVAATPVSDVARENRLPTEIYGPWLLTQGTVAPALISGAQVTALDIQPDGFARAYIRDLKTDANDCVRVFTLFDGNTLVLDFSREPAFSFNAERGNLFPVVELDAQNLAVASPEGVVALFERQLALPSSVTCRTLNFAVEATGLPPANSFGDLVLYNGDLIYNSTDNQIQAYDLDTNSLVAPLGPTQSRFLQTSQGTDLWTHCGCGGSPDVFRRNLTTVFDTVHTGNDLGLEITVRAGAYNSATDRLWLHGAADATGQQQFLIVNTNGEPDVLVESALFDRSLRGLAFDGTDMWGFITIGSRSIVRIDTTTKRVIQTVELPDEDVFWTGLEFDTDGTMYLLGNEDDHAVLMRLVTPLSVSARSASSE